jgi:hypothetical protein
MRLKAGRARRRRFITGGKKRTWRRRGNPVTPRKSVETRKASEGERRGR